MLGAIAGDIIGSPYEFDNHRSIDFPLFTTQSEFTDDSILTVAVADAILNGTDLVDAFHDAVARYPGVSWGGSFRRWAAARSREPYGSWGNGSAMRASPCGWAFDTRESVLEAARRSAAVTHNHPLGIFGAQYLALAVWMARNGASKAEIVAASEDPYRFDPQHSLTHYREHYRFDESCQGTIPAAVLAFRESDSFEGAIRIAVSIGGDTDTICCIVGAIAEAHYGLPDDIEREALARLDDHLRPTVEAFRAKYCRRSPTT